MRIKLLELDQWGDEIDHGIPKDYRISVLLGESREKHSIQFPANSDRVFLANLLHELADMVLTPAQDNKVLKSDATCSSCTCRFEEAAQCCPLFDKGECDSTA